MSDLCYLRKSRLWELYWWLTAEICHTDMCPFLRPLIPLCRTSGDVSSVFQSQSGFCLIRAWWKHKCYTFPEIYLWCDTYQPLGGQHDSRAIFSTYLWGIGGTRNWELSCHRSQCEIRQTLYRLSCPGSATTHSVRSGRRSTNWAVPAQPPLTVWDQAEPLPTEVSRLGLSYGSLTSDGTATATATSGMKYLRILFPLCCCLILVFRRDTYSVRLSDICQYCVD